MNRLPGAHHSGIGMYAKVPSVFRAQCIITTVRRMHDTQRQRVLRANNMTWIITKYFLTAAVVVLVSELAKRSDKLGSFMAALPLVTVLALIWLYVENQPQEKIANHAWYTFWYVVPTLPMFLVFPLLLPRIGFWFTLLACVVVTLVCFGLFALLVRRFGIDLLS